MRDYNHVEVVDLGEVVRVVGIQGQVVAMATAAIRPRRLDLPSSVVTHPRAPRAGSRLPAGWCRPGT